MMAAKGTAQTVDSTSVADLPLREETSATRGPLSDVVVVFITGDGGWVAIDKGVAAVLEERGASVVGLDARHYLSKKRTPDEVARDVTRIALHYARLWSRSRVVLAGYSRGADWLPFVANRMPPELKARVALIAMLGLGTGASFELHWRDIVQDVRRPSDVPTFPEVTRVRGLRMLCIYGADETDSGCAAAPAGLMQLIRRPGKHHFDKDYAALGALVADAIPTSAR